MTPLLEEALIAVEADSSALGEALRSRDAPAIERQAAALRATLARVFERFADAARQGVVPRDLRRRLAMAGARVAAQRETLARSTAALDRAIDVLLPRDATSLYGARGAAERGVIGQALRA